MKKALTARLSAAVLALMMAVMLMLTPAAAASWTDGQFTDVSSSNWFYDAVRNCYETGMMNGMTDTTFVPTGTATRAQVVVVLYRLAGSPAASSSSTFTDVQSGQWYTEAVSWASGAGIAAGYNDGTFRPNNSVTRQEFLTFLYRYAGYAGVADATVDWSGYTDSFPDASSISSWAESAENWSVGVGLQTGSSDGGTVKLNPTSSITRAELATFLSRFHANSGRYRLVELLHDCYMCDISNVTAVVGEPNSTEYIDSCMVLGGQDGIWYYDGFTVYTIRYEDGTELLYDIVIED